MVTVTKLPSFEKKVGKIKHADLRGRVEAEIRRIIGDREVGTPMRYGRKGTREVVTVHGREAA